MNVHGTLPKVTDSDGDNLWDGDEVNLHGTSPTDADSDDDGFTDGWEIALGTDPNDGSSQPGLPALGLWARGVLAVLLVLGGSTASSPWRRTE